MTTDFIEFIDNGGCRQYFFPSFRDYGIGNTSSAADHRNENIYEGLICYHNPVKICNVEA